MGSSYCDLSLYEPYIQLISALADSVCNCLSKMYLAMYSQGEEHFTVLHLLNAEEFFLTLNER